MKLFNKLSVVLMFGLLTMANRCGDEKAAPEQATAQQPNSGQEPSKQGKPVSSGAQPIKSSADVRYALGERAYSIADQTSPYGFLRYLPAKY